MSPSHSTPEQVSNTIKQIIFLLDTIDNKVLIAYRELLSKRVREYPGSWVTEYRMLEAIFTLKIVLQNERRKSNDLR